MAASPLHECGQASTRVEAAAFRQLRYCPAAVTAALHPFPPSTTATPQVTTKHQRTLQGNTGHHSTPQGTTGHHRAPQSTAGHHRAPQLTMACISCWLAVLAALSRWACWSKCSCSTRLCRNVQVCGSHMQQRGPVATSVWDVCVANAVWSAYAADRSMRRGAAGRATQHAAEAGPLACMHSWQRG